MGTCPAGQHLKGAPASTSPTLKLKTFIYLFVPLNKRPFSSKHDYSGHYHAVA